MVNRLNDDSSRFILKYITRGADKLTKEDFRAFVQEFNLDTEKYDPGVLFDAISKGKSSISESEFKAFATDIQYDKAKPLKK
jgi:hypothetical protein